LKFFQRMTGYGTNPEVIYDLAASDGMWSNATSAMLANAAFHLFEPQPGNYDSIMQAILSENPSMTLHNIVLRNATSTVTLHVTEDCVRSSIHPLSPPLSKEIEMLLGTG
jgi:FkbM family methyltransferase